MGQHAAVQQVPDCWPAQCGDHPSASYTIGLTDSLNIQPGFTSYNYSQSSDSEGFYRHTFEPNLALNYTVTGVTLTPKAYYDVVLRGPTYELNGAYVILLKAVGTELTFLARSALTTSPTW